MRKAPPLQFRLSRPLVKSESRNNLASSQPSESAQSVILWIAIIFFLVGMAMLAVAFLHPPQYLHHRDEMHKETMKAAYEGPQHISLQPKADQAEMVIRGTDSSDPTATLLPPSRPSSAAIGSSGRGGSQLQGPLPAGLEGAESGGAGGGGEATLGLAQRQPQLLVVSPEDLGLVLTGSLGTPASPQLRLWLKLSQQQQQQDASTSSAKTAGRRSPTK